MTNEPTIFIEVPQEVMDLFGQEIPVTMPAPEIDESMIKGDPMAEEKIITDVWVGIVLTLLVMSCVACMCSCVIYHRFQIWKRSGEISVFFFQVYFDVFVIFGLIWDKLFFKGCIDT